MATKKGTSEGFSDAERAAMKARAAELRAARGGGAKKEAARQACLDLIAAMPEPDRSLAERIHALVTEAAPELDPKTWYGMPAYAKDGKVLCFLQVASKFDARYATFGFQDAAQLDDGNVWPTSFAVTKLTRADEKRLAGLVRKAVGRCANLSKRRTDVPLHRDGDPRCRDWRTALQSRAATRVRRVQRPGPRGQPVDLDARCGFPVPYGDPRSPRRRRQHRRWRRAPRKMTMTRTAPGT